MLDEKEISIIQQLRKNARTNLVAISDATNIPKSTVFDKIGRLEGNTILKHTSIVDFKKLGFNSRYVFLVRVNPESRDSLREFLSSHPSINNLHITNSEYDYLFEGVFKDNREMNDFKTELSDKFPIAIFRQHELIEDLQREVFMEGK